jgi:hypothetical protein
MRFPRLPFLVVGLLLLCQCAVGQSPNGTINGLVLDPSNQLISGAEIIAINDLTNVRFTTKTNNDGVYVLPNLPPGPYRLQVSKAGFKTIVKPDIVLNVQDALSVNFTLPIGALLETVTVRGGAPVLNTTDGSVSTVVDQNYIANLPLNGRSFQDLILLTPGVVTNTPQQGGSVGSTGEFSVNGQRTESNYYTVDGVSANTGVYPDPGGPGNSGSLPAATALGTTQALLSVDALQEFRVQSSTYSAEFGRNPGGQFSLISRSGTNQWHGTAFDYLRNSYVDANNWFNDYYNLPQALLRQNDFGGILGGPIVIPLLYNGRDKTFFFFSYEGLRLTQPQAANLNFVPDVNLRAQAPAPLQAALNAFPLPTPNTPDLGNGLGEFIAAWSNPSAIDAYSLRLDHNLGGRIRLFFRFGDTPSSAVARQTSTSVTGAAPSVLGAFDYKLRTYTFGSDTLITNRVSNDFRLSYSSNFSTLSYRLDSFGGAQPISLAGLSGISTASAYTISLGLSFENAATSLQEGYSSALQHQWNLVDSATVAFGKHELKLGVDYRRVSSTQQQGNPAIYYSFLGAPDVQTNDPGFVEPIASAVVYPLFTNFSAFVQDEWKMNSRFNLSMGLRWDVNPAPTVTNGPSPYTIEGADNLGTATLAPEGTSLWRTTWYNLAPRLGAAYVVRNTTGRELVVRGGGGLFFDTGQQTGTLGFLGPGISNSLNLGYTNGVSVSFPLVGPQIPTVTPPTPPYSTVLAFPPHLQLPYSLQWNVAIEQSLGRSQAVSASYVGSHGARLLEWNEIHAGLFNPNFSYVIFSQNAHTSDFNSLQLQFHRRLTNGLTAIAGYTFAHSIDWGSTDTAFPYFRGNSDFDVRHSFSSALSYDVPASFQNSIARAFLHGWGIDDRLSARTSFPVTLDGPLTVDPATGQRTFRGLDLLPGNPIYLYGANCASTLQSLGDLQTGQSCPGGRAVNPNAFTNPPAGQFGDAPRNLVRGFGAWQMDIAVRREFPLCERLKLQFRAEAFNVFNHPDFGYINPFFGSPTFGQATSTLDQSLGTLSSAYQTGGARSMQFALKLIF